MKILKPAQFLLILVISLLLLVFIVSYFYQPQIPEKVQIGVSFSPNYARKLGLDWQQAYLSLLTDLKVKNLRLNSYWRELEPVKTQYNFENLDFMVAAAEKEGVKIMLVVGPKQPGWPECFAPNWAKQLKLPQRQQQALDFIGVVVKRYRDSLSITKWQVENEPLFNYGADCDPPDITFLKKEVALVHSLDPNRMVVVTDSGELGFWISAMQYSDIFGTTLYRKVHNPIFGFFSWPLPPGFYSLKSDFIRSFFAPNNKKTIISELQAEPWISSPLKNTPIDQQIKVFSLADFKNNTEFAQKTGFDEVYLWGAPWWYFMAKNGRPEYLEYAKGLFNKP